MLLNGQAATDLSLLDRGLAYGDGLFETILVAAGRPVLLEQHLARLARGCQRLGLQPDWTQLQREILSLLSSLPQAASHVVLKVMLTRSAGGRGYRPASSDCNRILTLHSAPADAALHSENGIAAFVCQQRLALQPALAGLKHLNRLEQVLASQEWPDDSVQEGLMLDMTGAVIEGTRSNVFLVTQGKLVTPAVDQCGVAGVLRELLLQKFGNVVSEQRVELDTLLSAQEVFVCNSIFGVWPVIALRHGVQTQHYASGQYARAAQRHFQAALAHAN
jgi:4-amino-4-deoxychorismate lyase